MSNDPTIPAGRRAASASSSGVRPKLPYCVVVNGQDFACFASKATAESDAETLRRGHARKGFKTEVRVRTRTGFGGTMVKKLCDQAGWKHFGETEYVGPGGRRLRLFRRGQRAQWVDVRCEPVGPRQSNVGPALAWAYKHGFHDPSMVHLLKRKRRVR